MKLASVTPLVLTWNEAPNIERVLERLTWAAHVVVVDSGSTDETKNICEKFDNVSVTTRPFDCHSKQWNFGCDLVTTPWVLGLDADFVVPIELPAEIESISESTNRNGFRARFRYLIDGKPLRGALYPPRTVLFRNESCSYIQDGHTQLLKGDVPCGDLTAIIDHDDRKPLKRWLVSQQKYAALEAEKLTHISAAEVGLADRLRLMLWLAPPVTLLYTLLIKLTILDGWKGIFYSFQRTYAEMLLSLELLDRKVNK